MKYRKLLPIIIFIVIFSGILLWQRRSSATDSISSRSTPNQSTNDSSETTDSSSFIEQLRQGKYGGGEITIEETVAQNNGFTSYIFSYPSDNLKIYGKMNIPKGNGLFPVVILNHGYFNQSSFTSGDGTDGMADILAKQGYLTLASDYRGFGTSEDVPRQQSPGHRPEYAIDVLNLIASVKTLDKADADRIGMWGHSMGGEVSLRAIETTDKVKAVVLWAPTSGRSSDNASFYGGRGSGSTGDPDDEGTSPINYLKYIAAPISLHQGLSDTEVNPEWAKELNDALKKERKSVEYFEYEGQDHNFKNLGWDLISQRTVAFYNKYLK